MRKWEYCEHTGTPAQPDQQLRVVPVCQRQGCDRPLHSMKDRRYFWTRENGMPPVQVVFCPDCFAELQSK